MNSRAIDVLAWHLAEEMALHLPLPYTLYLAKDWDPATGERPAIERPFIGLFAPRQGPNPWMPKCNTYQLPYRDATRLSIYVETPIAIEDGSTIHGGYDYYHVPAVEFVRDFIRRHRGMTIPPVLSGYFDVETLALQPDRTAPEQAVRLKDGDRHVFWVGITYITTTYDEEAT